MEGLYLKMLWIMLGIEEKNSLQIIPVDEFVQHNEESKSLIYNSPFKYSENMDFNEFKLKLEQYVKTNPYPVLNE